MWQKVAESVKDEPNLLGYEMLNEPVGGNIYKNPFDAFFPTLANQKYLFPGYEKIYKGIRSIDKNNLIFYEPGVFDIYGGFSETIGGEA